jgi:hypothetical protein
VIRRIISALCVAGTASAVALVATSVPAQAVPASFAVNFAADNGASTRTASGFLHGVEATSPAQYLVDAVNVRALRGADHHPNLPSLFDPATQSRVSAAGAQLMVGLYYYVDDPTDPRRPYRPGDNGDWQTWRNIVTEVYNESVSRGYPVHSWITWNEPDIQWNTAQRPFSRYLQAHDVAYETVKALSPSQRIQAPELTGFNFSRLTEFLTYCKANNCIPDVLSWHELTANPSDVEGHTAQMRQWLINNGITPMPFAITEYQGTCYGCPNAWNAGQNVSWIARMERSAANGLAYGLTSAWEWHGSNSNFVATLGNLTVQSADLPRAVWWNYNTVKDMTGRRVGVTRGTGLDGLADSDPARGRATILIGNQDTSSKEITLTLNNLGSAGYLQRQGQVHVIADRIVNTGSATFPATVVDADYTVSGNTVTLSLPSLPAHGVYRVRVTSATAAAPKTSFEAESLPTSASGGVTHRTFVEAQASGGQATALDATAPGQYVRYTVTTSRAAVYNINAILKREAARGVFQLYVNGVAHGQPRDEYGAFAYYRADLGNISLAAGNNVLEFRSVARNPSSSSYRLTFDRFDLTPVT